MYVAAQHASVDVYFLYSYSQFSFIALQLNYN